MLLSSLLLLTWVVMLFETMKLRITEAVKMKERVFANSDGLKLEITSGTSASL